eukprot:6070657-Pleurochrysis_carterae.AAC.2
MSKRQPRRAFISYCWPQRRSPRKQAAQVQCTLDHCVGDRKYAEFRGLDVPVVTSRHLVPAP